MITERHVQALWYDRALRPGRLFAGAQEVRVVDPGAWNLGPGPDFLGAVLEVGPERRRIAGDVEVHLSPADWDAHRHGGDPAYRGVVAHVTWSCGPPPSSLPPGALSLWIGRFFTADPGFSPEAIDLGAYPFARLPSGERPCHLALRDDPGRALATLASAGRRRLAAKGARLRRLLAGGAPREQLFYSETMGALGYSRNARAFRAVAAAVPFRHLAAEPGNAVAALLAAAPFAGVSGGGRPRNAPGRRLAAAAGLFLSTPAMELMEARDFSPAGCRAGVGVLTARRLVGRGRAAAVFANVVVPWAIAEGRLAEAPAWLPAEDVSGPVRLAAFRLLGRDHNPAAFYSRNGLHIQGLIDIHRSFCLAAHPDCPNCRLFDIDGGM